jgi:hypothetical protein
MLKGPPAAAGRLYRRCGLRVERFGDKGIRRTQIIFCFATEGRMKGAFPAKNVSVESMFHTLVAGFSGAS